MDNDAVLTSFDIDSLAEPAARTIFANDQRLRFTLKSQDKIRAEDVDNRSIDFVLLDASHDLAMNRETFTRIEPLLAPRAILAVHDTGAWSREGVQLSPGRSSTPNRTLGIGFPRGTSLTVLTRGSLLNLDPRDAPALRSDPFPRRIHAAEWSHVAAGQHGSSYLKGCCCSRHETPGVRLCPVQAVGSVIGDRVFTGRTQTGRVCHERKGGRCRRSD